MWQLQFEGRERGDRENADNCPERLNRSSGGSVCLLLSLVGAAGGLIWSASAQAAL